ncbi:radical SAM family heme chaperone HemW [Aestuariibaculum sediminum]|uniref:Heme chaperone HemW n=1 Tax=Aestuariibaculum sediminum TaxID=2770637 RepID=A0A8J6Q1B7_9FLAO|nr:radical SAM family heme chaperone HemW [Aestuariibaculum sediminum]MBD0830876.1 radical SAM family heme chaperone HemW [Aestuariibaculum sediminum]
MAGIYIHIPFCKQACHYCDFHFSTSVKKKSEMVLAIIEELRLRQEELKDQDVETIYFGGGTPSLLNQNELDLILSAVNKGFNVVSNPEITLEANPDDLTLKGDDVNAIYKGYKSLGINRLSIGIQSFFQNDLKLMNRAHNALEAKACLDLATQYFDNISLDLIYGIPGLSHERWIQNIETALSFNIPHISSYALTVEPRTALQAFIKKGEIEAPNDSVAQEQFHILIEKLEAAGFVHYELSNFGKPNFFSKNNTAYWLGKPYLGIGPSAHSFNGKERSWNVKNNIKYIKAIKNGILPLEIETLTNTDRYNEYILTGLRTIWGVSLEKIENSFGTSFKRYVLQQSEKHRKQDLLFIENDVLKVTKKGKFLSDGIASDLFKID